MPKTNNIPQWIIMLLDNLNVEDFISYIEEPAIWDSLKPEYSNNVETEKSWQNVCVKVPEFESRPEMEKNKLGKSLHRRWKSLRDCYARELKKQKTTKTGAAASVRKRYIYVEQLRFLEPVHCTSESNVEMQEDEEESHDVEDGQVADSAGVPQYPQQSRSKKRKNQEDLLLEVLQKKIASKSNTTKPTEDADSMFLCSLLPELKKIPENHKLFLSHKL